MIQDVIREIENKELEIYNNAASISDLDKIQDKIDYAIQRSNSNFDSASKAINNTRVEIVECKKHIKILYCSLIIFAFITSVFATIMVVFLVSHL